MRMSAAVLYDRDCGFCTLAVDVILRCDTRHRLRPVAIQSPEGEHLLGPVAPERRLDSWHLVREDGSVVSAGAALAPLLRYLPGGRPAGAVLAAFPSVAERAYRLVADNRSRLASVLGVSPCRVDPAR
jgi:predicted DCC family thiol-disulfide oxidoreductase YuxK